MTTANNKPTDHQDTEVKSWMTQVWDVTDPKVWEMGGAVDKVHKQILDAYFPFLPLYKADTHEDLPSWTPRNPYRDARPYYERIGAFHAALRQEAMAREGEQPAPPSPELARMNKFVLMLPKRSPGSF